ncbi:MAG: DUF4330 domain-containing protein [Clostridia bacterium]|nr:DUF4330 domain-containing protein [Clostridia bacterium]
MIIDEKGRLFGKVSIVDIAVILFIVVVAVALVWRFAGMKDETAKVQDIKCSYECIVDNVRIESVNAVKNDIGKDVYDSQGRKIGTLVSAEEMPYETEIITDRGDIRLAEVPDKYSIKLTFEGTGRKANSGYVSGAGYEISIGSKPLLSLHTIDVEAQVLNITEVK